MLGKGESFLYQLNVTRDCNLRCDHCYIHSDKKRASIKMNAEQWLALVENVAEHYAGASHKHAEIHCVGGEPTMLGLPFFESVLSRTREILDGVGKAYDLRLISNLLTPESVAIARLFGSVGTAFEEDIRFPKDKLFQRWKDHVAALRDDPGVEMGVGTTITRVAISQGADRLLDFLVGEIGFRRIYLGFFIPSGDGRENDGRLTPAFAETSEFLIDAAKWHQRNASRYPGLNIDPIDGMMRAIETGTAQEGIICPVGVGCLDVDADGNAATCIEVGGEVEAEFFGNVFETPIKDLLSSPGYLSEVRRISIPKRDCLDCDERALCQGGCHVLHQRWDNTAGEDCPGFYRFIKYMRRVME